MSYNYLPLDRKQLHFDQVKNLLDFDQLVSITFYAHEQIENCRNYLDKKLATDELFEGINVINTVKLTPEEITQLQYNILTNNAVISGDEIAKAIVKLTLMLKIKSLSYGQSGIDIETVKRLMEMYNNNVLPIIFATDGYDDKAILSQLSLPLIGLGMVYFNGEKMPSATALKILNWQPLQLKSKEALALINGNQYTCACGLYQLKMAETQLQAANNNAPQAYEVFDKMMTVFMAEANNVVDSPQIFAEQDSIIYLPLPTNQIMVEILELLRSSDTFSLIK
ncbi:MAG: aromatic amino acid lyase [Deinococcales bacterium]|nr:aromatic amino acid lyase [Chitinophagaceae bacterium]